MTELRMTRKLFEEIHADISRPHPFAGERVGFVFGKSGTLSDGGSMVVLTRYHSIADDQYIEDETVGARIGGQALTEAMQAVYYGRPVREGIFHIHVHHWPGETGMSGTDRREIPPMIPGFQSAGKDATHGIVILSLDHGTAWIWRPGEREPAQVDKLSIIGVPIEVFIRGKK